MTHFMLSVTYRDKARRKWILRQYAIKLLGQAYRAGVNYSVYENNVSSQPTIGHIILFHVSKFITVYCRTKTFLELELGLHFWRDDLT